MGPTTWRKFHTHCLSSGETVPAMRDVHRASQGATTLTAAGSARHGTKRVKAHSLAHRAAERQTAAKAAEARVLSVALERGETATLYMVAGTPLVATKWHIRRWKG
jgi:hypothetical protein